MSQRKTFSTGFNRSLLRNFWGLLKAYRHNNEFALQSYRVFRDACCTFERHLGRGLEETDILEIGSGQRFTITLLFQSLAARAVGIDMDHAAKRADPGTFVQIWRRNGLERAVKTFGRKLLFDRAYYREVARLAGRPLRLQDVDLRVMDACALEFPDQSFDLVFSSNVFEHIHDVGRATREMARVLRPGAIALIGICPFCGLSGGHHPDWASPDEMVITPVPPWDHLRQNLYPADTYLNRLREQDYLAAFSRHLQILDVESSYQGERHLTPELELELSDYSREELLKGSLEVTLRKAAALPI